MLYSAQSYLLSSLLVSSL